MTSPYLVSGRTRETATERTPSHSSLDRRDEPFESIKTDALGLRQARFDEVPAV
jgi:hypothetical protein